MITLTTNLSSHPFFNQSNHILLFIRKLLRWRMLNQEWTRIQIFPICKVLSFHFNKLTQFVKKSELSILFVICSCLMLLRSLIPESNRIPFIQFVGILCECLESLPILLLFETSIRLQLYYILQLITIHQPSLLSHKPSLVLLLYELQFWFSQSKVRLRSHPCFSSINQGSISDNGIINRFRCCLCFPT